MCPTVTVSSSTLITGRVRTRSRICWNVFTKSITSAAISGSVPSSSMNSFSEGLDRTASSICCFCRSICAADLNFSCSRSRFTNSVRGSACSSGAALTSRGNNILDFMWISTAAIDEIGGHVHVQLANLFHVGQVLRRDAGDGNVVNVDILLADQVEQQIERPLVDVADGDCEG